MVPTGDEYRDAAGYFAEAKTTVTDLKERVKQEWIDAVTVGPLRELIERTVTASRDNIDTSGERFDALIDACKGRADICDGYDAQIRAYNSDLAAWKKDPDRVAADKPWLESPPHPWVTPSVKAMS